MDLKSLLSDFTGSLAADLVSRKLGVGKSSGGGGGGGGGNMVGTMLAGTADALSIAAKKLTQTDESAKDSLNRAIVSVKSIDKKRKLGDMFLSMDNMLFASVARNIDDLLTDKLDNQGKSIEFTDKDPRVIFLEELGEMSKDDALHLLHALRFDIEPRWKDSAAKFTEELKRSNDDFARRHNLKG